MYCTRCGAPLEDDAKFCTSCGMPVGCGTDAPEESEPSQNELPQKEAPGKKKTGRIVAGIVAGVVLAVGIGLLAAYAVRLSGENKRLTAQVEDAERTGDSALQTEGAKSGPSESIAQSESVAQTESVPQTETVPQTESIPQTEAVLPADFTFSDDEWRRLSYAGAGLIQACQDQLPEGTVFDASSMDLSGYALDNAEGTDASAASASGLRLYGFKAEGNYAVTDAELMVNNGSGIYPDGLFRIWWQKDGSSLGYSAAQIQRLPQASPEITAIEASSTLISYERADKYQVANVADQDLSTAWVEGADGYGIGESLTLTFNGPQALHGLRIAGGYRKNQATYGENAKVTAYRLEFSDGTTMDVTMGSYPEDGHLGKSPIGVNGWETVLSTDGRDWNSIRPGLDFISFGREITTDYVKLTILEVAPGTVYEDTCITEISAY